MVKKMNEIKSPISWDEYFFKIVDASSLKSKDPNTKVGAVIVDENRIISIGYNGFPQGIKDTEDKWQKPKKYDYVVHAEMNAIFNSERPVRGCRIYLPFWPCRDCAKNLAAAGIVEINVKDDYYRSDLAEEIFRECNIKIINHTAPLGE
jgi:dCMP deaminase